ITSMLAQGLSKGTERFGAAPFDHQQQSRAVAIQHVGHVTVPPPGAGLIDGDSAHRAPVAPCLAFLHLMDHHPPQTPLRFLPAAATNEYRFPATNRLSHRQASRPSRT